MAGQEEDQNDAGEGDDELFPDGGGPVSIEATGEGIHDNKEEVAALAARGIDSRGPGFQEESQGGAESVMRMAGFAEWPRRESRKPRDPTAVAAA